MSHPDTMTPTGAPRATARPDATDGKATPAAADTRPAMIEIVNFTKKYDDFVAVDNVSLSVKAGELFCVLGPNGAGKTTTLKTLVGLLRPTTGSLTVGGFDIQHQPVEAKRLIGYIPDQPYLYEKLTGRDMFRFTADLFGVSYDVAEERMMHYFELFKLTEAVDMLIEKYSHGMRQKLCFSLALMHRPEVVIVDEPNVGLDPQSHRIVKNLLRSECRRGATVLLSTHSLDVVEELADRLVIYKRGKIIYEGTYAGLQAQLTSGASRRLEDLFLELTMEEGDDRRLAATE